MFNPDSEYDWHLQHQQKALKRSQYIKGDLVLPPVPPSSPCFCSLSPLLSVWWLHGLGLGRGPGSPGVGRGFDDSDGWQGLWQQIGGLSAPLRLDPVCVVAVQLAVCSACTAERRGEGR